MKPSTYTLISIAALAVIAVGTYAHVGVAHLALSTNRVCSIMVMPHITAHAAIVYDIQTDTALFSKNAEAQLPLASITKITTAIIAAESLNSNDTVTISEQALTPEGDSGLFSQEVWSATDLVDFMLMTSSNDGARALALQTAGSVETFVENMNMLAERIGAHQTYFLNETGLDVSSTTAGAYGSARDVALFLGYAYDRTSDALYGSTQAASVYTSLSGFEHEAVHTSDVAGSVPGQVVVKTGFTDLAGGNLAVLAEVLPGRPVAIVVLGATRETRDADIAVLFDAAKDTLKHDTLCGTL